MKKKFVNSKTFGIKNAKPQFCSNFSNNYQYKQYFVSPLSTFHDLQDIFEKENERNCYRNPDDCVKIRESFIKLNIKIAPRKCNYKCKLQKNNTKMTKNKTSDIC